MSDSGVLVSGFILNYCVLYQNYILFLLLFVEYTLGLWL